MVGGFGRMGVKFGGMGALNNSAFTDTTAPTLTLPLALPLGDTSGYLGVTTNEANGTLYYVVTTSATPPSAAQVKAGQNNGGTAAVYAGSQAVSATGAQSATATGLSSATAYYAYFMHEDAGGNQSSVSASSAFTTLTTGTSDTSFDDLVAAMTGTPTDLRKGYIARCIGALYAGGVWAKTDVLWMLAAHDAQAARLNWITPASFTLSEVNSPTFTTDRGYAGDGSTSYLDTGWDAATNGVSYTQNSAHAGVYARTDGNGNVNLGTGTNTNATILIQAKVNGSSSRVRVNATSAGGSTPTGQNGTMPLHRMGVRRASATDIIPVLDGADGTSISFASTTLSATDLNFGRYNLTSFGSGQTAAGHVGGALDATEGLAFYNALHDYMVAVGADT